MRLLAFGNGLNDDSRRANQNAMFAERTATISGSTMAELVAHARQLETMDSRDCESRVYLPAPGLVVIPFTDSLFTLQIFTTLSSP